MTKEFSDLSIIPYDLGIYIHSAYKDGQKIHTIGIHIHTCLAMFHQQLCKILGIHIDNIGT
jgi:hypothetical protein